MYPLPPPPPPPEGAPFPPPPEEVVVPQVPVGVMVSVTVAETAEIVSVEEELPQENVCVICDGTSKLKFSLSVEVTAKEDPESIVITKVPLLTTIDWTTAVVPEIFKLYPPTDNTVLVVRPTSLYAAKAIPGNTRPTMKEERISFFMSVR